jgi:hypothetical protein
LPHLRRACASRYFPWFVALVGGSLLSIVIRLTAFFLAATGLRLLGGLKPVVLAMFPGLDPVYTQAALSSLTDLQLQGLAIAGAPGAWLHTQLPLLVVEPSSAHFAIARVVVQAGSPVLARLVAAGMTHAGVLAAGLMLVRAGYRKRHAPLVLAGVAVQVQVAVSVLAALPSVRELDATGMSFAANALLPSLVQRSTVLGGGLDKIASPMVTSALVGLALLIGYAPAGLVLVMKTRAQRILLGTASAVVLSSAACAGIMQRDVVLSAPVPAPANPITPALPAPLPVRSVSMEPAAAFDRWYLDMPSSRRALSGTPSHVEVARAEDGTFQYLVNGRPEVIKGMGLNTQYAHFLSPGERAAQLDADMAALSALGVNTVLGWDPSEFDGVLLDAAQRHGVGVVMPFDLDPTADYTDPVVRQQLRDDVLAWVARYHEHPALRMWGLGNEILHKIVHPAWVGPQDPRQEQQAEAFSDWLVQTADAIHAADPNHPVTYRSAEDAFVDWVVAAMKRNGDAPRPWFVWGTNCYQQYLSDIVDHWPDSGMSSALWVSEFAPGGMAVPDRPDGFETMWGYIRRHPQWVLGGGVYAWTRNGPEGVDRNFGLTDDGVPVDGRSLDRLSALFHPD